MLFLQGLIESILEVLRKLDKVMSNIYKEVLKKEWLSVPISMAFWKAVVAFLFFWVWVKAMVKYIKRELKKL